MRRAYNSPGSSAEADHNSGHSFPLCKAGLSLLAFLLLCASPAIAQRVQIENTMGVGPNLGWYQSGDAEEGALFFGFLGRARLGNNVGVEMSLSYRDAELFHTGTLDPHRLTADVTYVPVTFSLMVFFPLGSFLNPYATGGVGYYYTIESYTIARTAPEEIRQLLKDEQNFEAGYHFGLGLEIPFSSNLAFHGEFRYLFLGTEIKTIRDLTTLDTDTKNSNGIMFSAGLMLYL
ncbi:MAG: porin family protein [Bacteroidetes bacterium]|nr:porin family protein [Bacteroidota bacterium]